MTLVIFFLHIQEWWINYQYSQVVMDWTLGIVLSVLVYPIILFMLARMLFPTGIRASETDLEAYFEDQWKWLYSIILATIFISIWQNSYIQGLPVMDSWPQMVFAAIFIVFLTLRKPPKWAHTALQLIFVVAMIAYIISEDTALGK